MQRLALILIPLLLIGCDREPVAPDTLVAPDLAATSTWTRASLFLDFVYANGVNTCVGEAWHGYGEVPYTFHEVANGAGGYSYTYRFLPVTPTTPQYSLTGLTSGTTWWYDNGLPYNESYHAGPGEVLQLKWHEGYHSDGSGTSPIQRLFFDGVTHATVNADGELVVDRVEVTGARCDKR